MTVAAPNFAPLTKLAAALPGSSSWCWYVSAVTQPAAASAGVVVPPTSTTMLDPARQMPVSNRVEARGEAIKMTPGSLLSDGPGPDSYVWTCIGS
jgi:hypothetical protein